MPAHCWNELSFTITAGVPLPLDIPEYLPPDTLVGNYKVITFLGRGGGGTVYLTQNGEGFYAIKLSLYKPDMEEADWNLKSERVMREFDTLNRLHHPNIIRVYGVGWYPSRENGVPYIGMEWVEGKPFLDWVEHACPPLGDQVKVLASAAGALEAMHAAGLCHRDVKSSNILVGPNNVAKLIDMGISQGLHRPITGARKIIGTFPILPPEFAAYWHSGSRERFVSTPAADRYCLGYLLYEMITGRSPLRTSPYEFDDVFAEIHAGTPVPPQELVPTVPKALASLAMALLSKNPDLLSARPERDFLFISGTTALDTRCPARAVARFSCVPLTS